MPSTAPAAACRRFQEHGGRVAPSPSMTRPPRKYPATMTALPSTPAAMARRNVARAPSREQADDEPLEPVDDEADRRPLGVAAQQVGRRRPEAPREQRGERTEHQPGEHDRDVAEVDVPLRARDGDPRQQGEDRGHGGEHRHGRDPQGAVERAGGFGWVSLFTPPV